MQDLGQVPPTSTAEPQLTNLSNGGTSPQPRLLSGAWLQVVKGGRSELTWGGYMQKNLWGRKGFANVGHSLAHVSPAFSLLVVDECHHTHKDTVYNVILSRYLEHKLQRTRPLPQVLGLTASPGTGGASTLEGAVDHILQVSLALVTLPPPEPPLACRMPSSPPPPVLPGTKLWPRVASYCA